MRWRRRMVVAAVLAFSGCSSGEAPVAGSAVGPGGVTLVYSGNVDGEIEPCG